MKSLFVSFLLFSNFCLGIDQNICGTLLNVIQINQDRFDQAEIAFGDISAVCKNDLNPKQCAVDVKTEFEASKIDLAESKKNFSDAGCSRKTNTASCKGIDRTEREYLFEFNLDSGEIQKKSIQNGNWEKLYNSNTKCGLPVRKSSCEENIKHNIYDPNKPFFAIKFSAKCKTKNGTLLPELGGYSEINTSGDGNGNFICGKLSSNVLRLSGCTLAMD